MSEPRTEAGWALYAFLAKYPLADERDIHAFRNDILAIEAAAISAYLASPEAVEELARALGTIAIEDRDRTIAGDYRSDTYEEHANRLLDALRKERETP